MCFIYFCLTQQKKSVMQDVDVFSGYILPIKSINPCGTFVKLIAVRRLTLFYNVYRLCLHLPAPQPLAVTQYS